MLDEICSKKFNHFQLNLSLQALNDTKQITFLTIKDYFKQIKRIVKEIANCKKWCGNEINVLLESKFIENLTAETKIKMIESEKNDIQDIIEYITNIENVVANFKNNIKGEPSQILNFKKVHDKNFNQKYCKFHKSKTHNTNECYSIKKNPTNHKNNFIVKNNNKSLSLLYVNAEVQDVKIDVIVDTGSNYSLISKKTFEKLSISETKIDIIKLQTASNEIIKSTGKIKTQITFNELKNANFNIELLIIDC
ncbi:hypothetical protein DMUE_4686 [Dictyocoela muelleri]|nr:hypothetical protein DMUE_4686 [Dictyocoela muelleri]